MPKQITRRLFKSCQKLETEGLRVPSGHCCCLGASGLTGPPGRGISCTCSTCCCLCCLPTWESTGHNVYIACRQLRVGFEDARKGGHFLKLRHFPLAYVLAALKALVEIGESFDATKMMPKDTAVEQCVVFRRKPDASVDSAWCRSW